jgi:hypothetical protein
MVYQWSNWVFACHDCNHAKGEKWPAGGYIDPCAKSGSARPENLFDFDIATGEIIAKGSLSPARRKKAVQMIDDLHLNELQHRRKRRARVAIISEILAQVPHVVDLFRHRLDAYADRRMELSSVSRFMTAQLGYSWRIRP